MYRYEQPLFISRVEPCMWYLSDCFANVIRAARRVIIILLLFVSQLRDYLNHLTL